MSERVVYTCDRCHDDIVTDARYTLRMIPEERTESEPISLDVCGYCAGQIRNALSAPGRVIVEIPDPVCRASQ